MEIIKELKRQERKKKIRIRITKGTEVGIKLKGTSEIIKGKIMKNSGSNFKIEMGRKKKRIEMRIPKRNEIVEEILF